MSAVCRRLGMTRQNYYAKRRRRGAAEADTGLVAELARRERETQPRIGGRKLRVLLRAGLEEAGVSGSGVASGHRDIARSGLLFRTHHHDPCLSFDLRPDTARFFL